MSETKIQSNFITDGSVTTAKIADGTVTAAKLSPLINFFPAGGIIMWSGSVASIPTGWVLCNGSNGTPDLRNRFIVGAGSGYAAAATGGTADAVVVSHIHGITEPNAGTGHAHNYVGALSPSGNGSEQNQAGSPEDRTDFNYGRTTSNAVTGITINSQGVSGTNMNLPPYYALAFIMKT